MVEVSLYDLRVFPQPIGCDTIEINLVFSRAMSDIDPRQQSEAHDAEKDEDENDEEEPPQQQDKDKKHNSGAADLEKV